MPDNAHARRHGVSHLLILTFAIFLLLCNVTPSQAQGPATTEAKAKSLGESGEFVEAAQLYRQALKEHQQRLAKQPDDAALILAWCSCRNGLAVQQVNLGQYREAKILLDETFERLRVLAARTPNTDARAELARTWECLATLAGEEWLHEEAERAFGRAIEVQRKLVAEPGVALERRVDLVRMQCNHASYLMLLARDQEATAAYEDALAVARKLSTDCPDLPEPVMHLALTYNSYALLVRESGQFARAADMIREAIRLLTRLEDKYPDRPEYWFMLPTFYRNLSQPLAYLNNGNEQAIAKHEAERVEARLARLPDGAKKWATGKSKIVGAVATWDTGRLVELQDEVDSDLQTAEADFKRWPELPLYRVRLATAKLAQGLRLAASGKGAEDVLPLFAEGQALSDKLADQFPDLPRFTMTRAIVRITTAFCQMGYGQPAEADASFAKGFAEFRTVADDYPRKPELRFKLTQILLPAFPLYMQMRDWTRAGWVMAAVREEAKKLAEANPRCLKLHRPYAMEFGLLTQLRLAEGDGAAAEAAEARGHPSVAANRGRLPGRPGCPEHTRGLPLRLWPFARAEGTICRHRSPCRGDAVPTPGTRKGFPREPGLPHPAGRGPHLLRGRVGSTG